MANNNKVAQGIGFFLGAIFLVAFVGWIWMLLFGVLYAEFGWLAPIGFWPALGLGVLVGMLKSYITAQVVKQV